jgi:hypothetical protein
MPLSESIGRFACREMAGCYARDTSGSSSAFVETIELRTVEYCGDKWQKAALLADRGHPDIATHAGTCMMTTTADEHSLRTRWWQGSHTLQSAGSMSPTEATIGGGRFRINVAILAKAE